MQQQCLVNLTADNVARTGQRVRLYNAAYNEYLFVSRDMMGNPPDNVVESHPNRDDNRNLFVLQSVGNDRFKIFNPATEKWLFVSYDFRDSNRVVEAHAAADESRIEDRNQFTFQSFGNGQYLIYSPRFGQYLVVSNSLLNGDNMVLSQNGWDGERSKFSLQLQ